MCANIHFDLNGELPMPDQSKYYHLMAETRPYLLPHSVRGADTHEPEHPDTFNFLHMSDSQNSDVILIKFSIVLLTASLSVILSVARFPVVRPGRVTALPVTNCRGVYPSLLTEVLWVQAAAFTRESFRAVFFSSSNFLMV